MDTPAPEQMEVALDAMDTDGVTLLVTVKLTKLEVAEVLDKQEGKVPPAVSLAEITSPLEGL
jgi:hypothetical protein